MTVAEKTDRITAALMVRTRTTAELETACHGASVSATLRTMQAAGLVDSIIRTERNTSGAAIRRARWFLVS